MQVIDYGNYFIIRFPRNQWFSRNLNAVKALPITERRYWPEKGGWYASGLIRPEVMQLAQDCRAKIIDPSEANPEEIGDIAPLPELTIPTPTKNIELRPYQKNGIAQGLVLKSYINGDEMGLGKEQPLYSKLATPQGWKSMGEIREGDYVIGSNGWPTKVTGVFPQGVKEVYRVRFSDGSYTDCGLDHLWSVKKPWSKSWITMSLNEIMTNPLKQEKKGDKGSYTFEIPMCRPVNFHSTTNFPIHPYLLGYLLGNGNFCNNSVRVSFPDEETASNLMMFLPDSVKMVQTEKYYWDITMKVGARRMNSNPIMQALDQLGLRGEKTSNKFIPQIYMTAPIKDRLKLLQGLMDSDGHAKNNGNAEFDNGSISLISQVIELVQSLGGIANTMTIPDRRGTMDINRVYISLPGNLNPFLLTRKRERYSDETQRRRKVKRKIVSIQPIGYHECQCISVEAENNLYLTDSYIVTHNTVQSIVTVACAHQQGEDVFPALVICPASLKQNWKDEIERFTGHKAMVLDDKNRNSWLRYYELGYAQFFITNYESLKKYFITSVPTKKVYKSIEIGVNENCNSIKSVIIDESHRLKDKGTQQTKFTLRIARRKNRVILLTGTPVVNKPIDLWPQICIMGHDNIFGPTEKDYKQRFCDGGYGASNLRALNYLLNKHCYFRREKKDVAKDLPSLDRQKMICEISTREEYNFAYSNFTRWMEQQDFTDEQIAGKLKAEALVQMNVLRQISARGKIDQACEFINEVLDAGEKLIVFCNLKAIVADLKAAYPNALTITGSDSTEVRSNNVKSFQTDPKSQLIICNIKAAGVGLTLTASSRVLFIEFPWTYADCVQCEARSHRIGQTLPVMCTYLLGQDTIDEKMLDIILAKKDLAQEITGSSDQMEMSTVSKLIDLFTIKTGSTV